MSLSTEFKNKKVNVGDVVRVSSLLIEEGKKRTHAFEGVVIAIRGAGENRSITIRKVTPGGYGVERIWPTVSPSITEVEVIKRGNVRRAKLYYLRQRSGKEATRVRTVEE